MERVVLHIDMDAFFAAVEVLDQPALKGRCVVVGADSRRGVVAAASYEARRYGIHSAMPIFKAKQRCSQLVIVAPRRRRYAELSRQIMAVLDGFSPLVEQVSIDEAYVDVTGCSRLFGSPAAMAARIKSDIRAAVALTCSVGVAPNKFLAKIASDMDKPDGLTCIAPKEVGAFVAALPVGKVPGVGRRTRETLTRMGVQTLGDLRGFPPWTLRRRLGKYGGRLMELAAGIDDHPVVSDSAAKSISCEQTLSRDTRDRSKLNRFLLKQAEDVGRQLRRGKMKARTITLKLKHSNFKQVTRSTTMPQAIDCSKTIYREVGTLLDAYSLTRSVRLVGVGVSGLTDGDRPVQMALFPAMGGKQSGWNRVDAAMDRITTRFGENAIHKASLCKDGGRAEK